MSNALQQVTESRFMDEFLQEGYDYKRPRHGDIRQGIVLSVGPEGAFLDLGLKRDGIASATDLQRLGQETTASIQVGDEVPAFILKPEDRHGNIPVSLHWARMEQDWLEARELLTNGEIWEGKVTEPGLRSGMGDLGSPVGTTCSGEKGRSKRGHRDRCSRTGRGRYE